MVSLWKNDVRKGPSCDVVLQRLLEEVGHGVDGLVGLEPIDEVRLEAMVGAMDLGSGIGAGEGMDVFGMDGL